MIDDQTLERGTVTAPLLLTQDERARTERAHALRVALLRAQYETARAASLSATAEFDD